MIKSFKLFTDDINEANLSIPDLSKPSNPKVSKFGPLRGDIILGKIKNKEKFQLKDGGKAIVELEDGIEISDTDGKYDPSKSDNLKLSKSRLKNSFINPNNGQKFKISDFIKTDEFGGGRGSSLGTIDTKIVETIQAYVFAFKQKYSPNKNLMVRMFDNDEILAKICQCGEAYGYEKISLDTIKKHKDYFLTFIKTANKFISRIGILSKTKKYNFHQISSGSSFAIALSESYRRSCKNSFGLIVNMAKWTPSDIWAVNELLENDFIEELKNINTVTDLNQFIDFNFGENSRSRNIVGISLKKISSRQENILVVINKETERPRFEINHISLSNNPFTKGLDIIIKRLSKKYPGIDKLNVRSNSSSISNINVEIIGSSSRHGKCSLNQINSFLKSSNLETVPLVNNLSKIPQKELSKMVMDLYDEMLNLESSEIRLGRIPTTSVTMPYLISKYQSLLLSKILINSKISDPQSSDKCINSIMYYALAIENQYFSCPKYARVVEY